MTTLLLATQVRQGRRLPEFAVLLGLSAAGLIISLALAAATWTDGPIVGP
jgi:hypothetical protein